MRAGDSGCASLARAAADGDANSPVHPVWPTSALAGRLLEAGKLLAVQGCPLHLSLSAGTLEWLGEVWKLNCDPSSLLGRTGSPFLTDPRESPPVRPFSVSSLDLAGLRNDRTALVPGLLVSHRHTGRTYFHGELNY